jgi:hypothetical protein
MLVPLTVPMSSLPSPYSSFQETRVRPDAAVACNVKVTVSPMVGELGEAERDAVGPGKNDDGLGVRGRAALRIGDGQSRCVRARVVVLVGNVQGEVRTAIRGRAVTEIQSEGDDGASGAGGAKGHGKRSWIGGRESPRASPPRVLGAKRSRQEPAPPTSESPEDTASPCA